MHRSHGSYDLQEGDAGHDPRPAHADQHGAGAAGGHSPAVPDDEQVRQLYGEEGGRRGGDDCRAQRRPASRVAECPCEAGFKLATRDDLEAAIEKKEIAAGVEPVTLPAGGIEVRIFSDMTKRSSQVAAGRIRAALAAFKENSVKLKLTALGLPESIADHSPSNPSTSRPREKWPACSGAACLGYCVVMLMFSGGMYPAIDMTAGEKERRTLEALLSSPASRGEIILGKILATTTAVIVTAVLSITSLIVSFRISRLGRCGVPARWWAACRSTARRRAGVCWRWRRCSVLAASLMIAIALFAKSFKEAQSYLTPLVMASMFPISRQLRAGCR